MRLSCLTTLILPLLAVSPLLAQSAGDERQEFSIGVSEVSGSSPSATAGSLSLDANVGVQANYAKKWRDSGWGNLYWEAGGMYVPIRYLTGTPTSAANDIHSVYITPGVRLQFSPKEKLSPWIAIDGAFAFYSASKGSIGALVASGGGNTATGGAGFGVGFDLAAGKNRALRADVHGIYTGSPNFGTPTPGGQFTFSVGIGMVWRSYH